VVPASADPPGQGQAPADQVVANLAAAEVAPAHAVT